jgi:hypothetical protein
MEEQGFENKERTVYLSSTGDFVKTDLTNPREIKYASEIQLANKERDKFYGLKAIPQDRAEITKAAMDSERGYIKQAAAGVGSAAVSMGQNLWNWARYTNANLINKGKRKLNELSASILKGTGAIDEETRANMMTQVNNDYKAVRDIINGEMLANREKQNAYLEKTGLAKKEGDSFVYDIANGVGSAAAALGLAIVTKSPNAAALMFGGVAGQSGYEEALAAGIEPEKALKVGLARGLFEGTLEKIGIHCYIEGLATRGVFARIAKNAAVEAVQEISQQTAEEILQTKYGGRAADWKRATEDILLSGFVGMIVGGGFASVGAGQDMLNEQKAKDTGAKPLPTQNVQNIDLTDVFESGVKRFTDLGMPPADAEKLTFSLLQKAAAPETAKEIADMIKEENSNLTYLNNDEDQNAAAVKEAVEKATAPERVVKQQAFNIADKVEEDLIKAGRAPEEAAADARIAQAGSIGLYNLTGVLPEDQIKIDIALEQSENENGLTGQEDTSFDVSTFNQGPVDVKSPEFKAWFGDSKVVDENGEPLVVYHGTSNKFSEFKGKKHFFTSSRDLADAYGSKGAMPVYLNIKNPLIVDAYGQSFDNIVNAQGFKKMQKDLTEKDYQMLAKLHDMSIQEIKEFFPNEGEQMVNLASAYGQKGKSADAWADYAKQNGYDGVIIKDVVDNTGWENADIRATDYIVFDPKQIKSVYNKGTFDKNNPNIYYQPGYHGSPTKFDRFDLNFIGTGEGAQAHGWGVYISKDFWVADNYRANLSREIGDIYYKGKKLDLKSKEYKIIAPMLTWISDKYPTLKDAYNASKEQTKYYAENSLNEDLRKEELERLHAKESIDIDQVQLKAKGGVFNVDIPESDVLLDEQKTFEEQPKKVQKALEKIAKDFDIQVKGKVQAGVHFHDITGKYIYNKLAGKLGGQKQASKKMLDYGIEGITYDGKQDGRCYVVFNDKAVKILQTFYQGPRGSVTFAEDIKQAFIRFNKTADASTFVHELGHIWLMNVQKMRPYAAKTEFDEFLNNLDSWLGAPVNGAYTVEQQEKFAQALEQYLQEGRAPNAELKTLFEKFKEWLSQIYTEIKRYIELSPEAIKTFDTLLAGTEKGQYNIDKIKTKTAAAKAVVDKIKKGQAVSIDGVSVQDIKEALKVMNSRIPAEPKENLLRTLRSKGADYANASKIDKEAYKNARVPNKKTGIQDGLALTLRDWGYMDFDDSAVADYEGLSEKDEEAADLIDRALSGEKIYKVGDEQANKREQFLNDVEKAREVLGPNGEEVARAITELEKKGYRVVEKEDINFLEKQLDQLNNIVDKARILEQNTEEQKKTEAFEKMQKQNALEARRIKTATLEELNKRDIVGKEKMFEDLQNAETPEEIFTAAADILTELEKEFAKTEEGQAEQRKIDVPATNWEAKKVTLLKDIAEISANATKEEQQARDIINEEHLAKQGLRSALSKEERAELEKARNLLKKSFEKKYLKAFNDALRDEPHIESKDVASIMKVLANNAMEMRLISNMAVNQFIDIAQRKQTANYKKYLSGKIDALLNSKTFAKVGQLRRAKFTPEIMEFMTRAKEIWGLTNMEALKQYDERVKFYDPDNVPSPTEALENRVLEFKALWDQQAPADAKGLYDELLELVRGDRALKQFEEAKKQFNESGRRLILTQALKERTLPKGTKTYLLNAGTDLQSALDVLFGKFDYETMGYDGKMHKATFNAREELAGELDQIEEQNFLHHYNMALDESVRSAYGLDTKFQMFDKIKELMDYKKEFINYGFVKDADTNTIATIFRGGKWVDNNKPRTQTLNKLNMIYNYIQYQNHEYVVTAGGIKDVGYAARLERAYGPKQLEEMFNCLTEQDKKFAEGLIELAGKFYPELNEVHKRIYGFALPKIEGVYFPGVTERIADDVDFHADFVANSKSPSFIKQRVKSVKPVVALVNPLAILKAHGRRSAEFIYNAERFTELKRLFKAEEMKTAFVDKFGQKDGIELYQKMLRLIDLQGPQKQKTKGEFFKVSDKIFNNWVKTAMGLKIMTGIKQVASGISFAEKMPANTYAKYFAEAVKHPVQTMDYMDKSFPYIETRFQTGGLNEAVARAMASNDISAMGEKFNMITNLGLLNTRYGDRISISIFGYPYYKYLREDLNLPEAEAKAEFLRQATTTLQSSLKSQLSEAQSVADNFATRVFMVFRNQQLQYVRKAFTTYAQYRNGEISAKQFAKAEFIYLVLNPLVYVALGLGFIPRDDEDKKRLAFAPITQTMGAYPFGEATAELLVDNIYSAFKEKKLTAPQKMGLPMIDDIVKDITRAVKSVNEDDLTAEDYIDATLGIAKYSGLPLNTFKSMIKGGRDIVKGKPAKGALEVIGYTESRAGKIVGEEKKKKKKRRK